MTAAAPLSPNQLPLDLDGLPPDLASDEPEHASTTAQHACSLEFVVMSTGSFKFIDLFAGIGGFHHALADLGGECALAVEIDADARRTYRAAFGVHVPLVEDIRSLTKTAERDRTPDQIAARVPDHDVLCAGFPCQPFSKSGAQMGTRDRTRGTLFFDVMTIVLAKEPRFVILENVRNLAGPRHTETWDTVVDSLQEAGYIVSSTPLVFSPHLLPKKRGGAGQVRDRVFVLAHRPDEPVLLEDRDERPLIEYGPVGPFDPHKGWKVKSILDKKVDLAVYGLRDEERAWLAAWQSLAQEVVDERGIKPKDLPGFPMWADVWVDEAPELDGQPAWKRNFLRKNYAWYLQHKRFIDTWRQMTWDEHGRTVDNFPPSRRKFEWQARREQGSADDRDLESLVAHFRPSGIRVKPPTYLPALVAITQTSVIGPKITGTDWRRLTPIEAAKLQGITDRTLWRRAGMKDSAAYKQLGNAVNVGVVRFLAERLFLHGGAPWLTKAHEEWLESSVAAAGA